MQCRHCNYIFEGNFDKCPNCDKPLKDEEETKVEEQDDEIELPAMKSNTSLNKDDELTAGFIAKDDPLKHIEETTKANIGMNVSRIAALIAIVIFGCVLYYTYVFLPKQKELLKKDPVTEQDIINQYLPKEGDTSNTTGKVSLQAEFGDTEIITLLKQKDVNYTKDTSNVDITLDYGKLQNGATFKVKLNRTLNNNTYSDNVSFVYNEENVSGIIRSYTNYNEDLITNIINSYVIKEFDGGVIMYSTDSTFQLGSSSMVLLVKDGTFEKIEQIITSYSTDGVSISKCPVTTNGSRLDYCQLEGSFKKSEPVDINEVTDYGNGEKITKTFTAIVAK